MVREQQRAAFWKGVQVGRYIETGYSMGKIRAGVGYQSVDNLRDMGVEVQPSFPVIQLPTPQ